LLNLQNYMDQGSSNDKYSSLTNVFVKKLDKSWTIKDLYEIFGTYGEIQSAKISLNPQTHKSNGYGYVQYMNKESASKAIEASQKGSIQCIVEPYVKRQRSSNKTNLEEWLKEILDPELFSN